MKGKITNCSDPTMWYSKYIGMVFDIDPNQPNSNELWVRNLEERIAGFVLLEDIVRFN